MLTTAALFSYLSERTNLTAAQIWFLSPDSYREYRQHDFFMLFISVSIFTAAAISDLILDRTSHHVMWGGCLTTE